MSKFEFIMMFVSVVVAFAMAELLVGWGKLVRARERIRRPFFMIAWSVWLLAIMNFHYLGFWEYGSVDFRTAAQMLLFLAAPILLVLVTFVFTPEIRYNQILDLEEHYFRIKNWFFVMLIIFFLVASTADSLLPGFAETWPRRLLSNMIMIPTLLVLLFTLRKWVHYLVLGFNLLLLFWSSYAINVGTL